MKNGARVPNQVNATVFSQLLPRTNETQDSTNGKTNGSVAAYTEPIKGIQE
jgi:hypothetical protein